VPELPPGQARQTLSVRRTASANVSCIGLPQRPCQRNPRSIVEGCAATLLLPVPHRRKAAIPMPFHHKVNEGLVQCSDCTIRMEPLTRKGLKSATQQDAGLCKVPHRDGWAVCL